MALMITHICWLWKNERKSKYLVENVVVFAHRTVKTVQFQLNCTQKSTAAFSTMHTHNNIKVKRTIVKNNTKTTYAGPEYVHGRRSRCRH